MTNSSRLMIGWREWVSLPDLGLPLIKAKLDTGARTSSLHAFELDVYQSRGQTRARFLVHPIQKRNDIIVTCDAPVIDYRSVSDSGGHREKRYVIMSDLIIGGVRYPIEITLANRESMSHRMLIGRSAMSLLLIDPRHSYMLGEPTRVALLYGASRTVKKKKKKSAHSSGSNE